MQYVSEVCICDPLVFRFLPFIMLFFTFNWLFLTLTTPRLQVSITKISTNLCQYYWGAGITKSHICVHDASPPAGDRPSACMGDSGGPMMCGQGHNILAGVTSWGEQTCSGTLPSVYTRVSAYLDWVRMYVNIDWTHQECMSTSTELNTNAPKEF